MNSLILLKDISQQNSYVKSLATTNARIAFTADDVTNATVKQLDLALVTVNGVRPKCFFCEPQLGVQFICGFEDVSEDSLSNEFTLQKGEFVSKDFGFIVPEEASSIYFLFKSLPSDEAATGQLNLAFHGGW